MYFEPILFWLRSQSHVLFILFIIVLMLLIISMHETWEDNAFLMPNIYEIYSFSYAHFYQRIGVALLLSFSARCNWTSQLTPAASLTGSVTAACS